MKIAVVGSRRRTDADSVWDFVHALDKDVTVISGGCQGPDTWAIEAAQSYGLKWKVFYPDLSGVKTYYDRVRRYYSRNEKVAKEADMVVAFVSEDRRGGTENTIKWARKYKKTVVVIAKPLAPIDPN